MKGQKNPQKPKTKNQNPATLKQNGTKQNKQKTTKPKNIFQQGNEILV